MSSKRKNKTSKTTSTTTSTVVLLEKQEIINIPIHSYLSRLQRNHGLLQHDYHQYRQYLTRRISRLRHTKVVRMNGSTFYDTGISGKSKQYKHAFVNKKLVIPYVDDSNTEEKDNNEVESKGGEEEETKQDVIIPHENFILILLLQSERSWAYGMEYKQQQQQQKSSSSSNHNPKHLQHITAKRRKQLFLSKFRKSISNIQKIQSLLKTHNKLATSQTLMECDAYEAFLKGNYFLEKKQWLLCYGEYYKCVSLCKTLIITSSTPEEEDVFKFRIEQDLEPVLRFCKYELMEGGMTEDQIANYLKQSKRQEKDSSLNVDSNTSSVKTTASYTVEFRSNTISIINEGLCIGLLKVDTLRKEQKEKTNKDWNVLIQEYDDISEIIQLEMSSPSLSQNDIINYKVLKQYIIYSKLQLLLQRNEYLVQDLLTSKKQKKQAKWEDVTHVYMLLLQDARSVVSCLQDGGTDDECLLLSQAQVMRYRALYCCSLGHCYASFITTNKSMTSQSTNDDEIIQENVNIDEYYHKAKGLYEHSLELASMAAEELSACSNADNNVDDLVQSMVTLDTEITGAKCRLEACRYLKSLKSASSHTPLLQRLNDSTLNANHGTISTATTNKTSKKASAANNQKPYFLIDSMPIQKYQYIPCKPTFFDLAWNYVEDMEPTKEELQKYIEELEVKEKGGSSRFLGWFYS